MKMFTLIFKKCPEKKKKKKFAKKADDKTVQILQ